MDPCGVSRAVKLKNLQIPDKMRDFPLTFAEEQNIIKVITINYCALLHVFIMGRGGTVLKRKKKRVGLLTKIFIAVFAIYAAVTLVNLQIRINAVAAEQEALQSRLEAQKLVCAELSDAISKGDNEDYIAKVARESLGYVYPGEQVFIDTSSK